ncbi:MAG: transposase [Raineya sp.]
METISHDAVLNHLIRESYEPKDLFLRSKDLLVLSGGTLSCDDSILEKPYSDVSKNELLGYHYSGKHHKVVKGICLVTLFYTDTQGCRLPVNYRIYQQGSAKSKNTLFIEMLEEVLAWGLLPKLITGDSWYASTFNLKWCRKHGLDALFAVEKDRLISTEKGQYQQVGQAHIPKEGLLTHLRAFDWVTVFRKQENGQVRHYVYYRHQENKTDEPKKATLSDFQMAHKNHWNIELYHRAIKQLCNIERFLVRRTIAVKNHIFSALWAFISLEEKVIQKIITNWYQFRENLLKNFLKQNLT